MTLRGALQLEQAAGGSLPWALTLPVPNMLRRIADAALLSDDERSVALTELERHAAGGFHFRLLPRVSTKGTSAARHATDLTKRGERRASYSHSGSIDAEMHRAIVCAGRHRA